MKDLAYKVASRTGLSKDECDGMIKIIVHEIIKELRHKDVVEIKGLGKIRRQDVTSNTKNLLIRLTKEAYSRLTAPYKKEEYSDEISFE
jgi:nucleoid DNA-binding protein